MAKNKFTLVVIFIFICSILAAQNFTYGYLVEFTNKANTIYSIDRPEEFLSARAIERRVKQNIEITEQDFPVNKTYTDSLLQYNSELHVTSRWFNSAVFYTNSSVFNSDALACSFVKKVTLVFQGQPLKSNSVINKWDSGISEDDYGASDNQITMCNAQKLHNNGFLGEGIQIAVLDAGFWRVNEMACFDSLYQNNRILSHWDFVSHNSDVFDDDTHGMGVLSIMGGNLPGQMMGTAPQASYHLFRTENATSEYPIEEENWIAGAERADSVGVDIITASLGYSEFDDDTMNYTYADMDGKSTRITLGAEIAFSKGIFIVNSVGNEGIKNWHYLTAPSDGENVLSVGAVNEYEVIAYFSSLGPSYDNRTKPDVVAKGLATTLIKADETVGTGNGTSYSCPVMTGMVACLMQALPFYSNVELLNLVRSLGDRYTDPSTSYGYGVPDFSKATFILDSGAYNQTSSDKLVKVFPNPFNANLSFHLYVKKGQEVEVEMYDARGIKVYSDKQLLNSASYNLIEITGLDKLEQGYYFLSVLTEEGRFNQKIVRE
jgi:hypothetical protein